MKEKFRKKMEDNSEYRDMKEKQRKRLEKSEKGINAYTVFLGVVCVIIAVVFFAFAEFLLGLIFLGLALVLGAMAYFSYREEKKNSESKNDKE